MNAIYSSIRKGYLLHPGKTLVVSIAIAAVVACVAIAAELAHPAKASHEPLANNGALATPLVHHALSTLNEAVKHLDAGQADLARAEVDQAQQLLGAVRHLLTEPEDRSEQGSTAPSSSGPAAGRALPLLTPVPPGTEESWDPWSDFPDDHEVFGEWRDMQTRMHHLLQRWRGDLGRGPGGALLSFKPDADLTDNGQAYVVRLDVPGSDKANIDVKVEGRVLTVTGKTESVNEQKDKDHVIRSERRSGQFERMITLPGPVLADKVEARYEKGVLTVTVPKAANDGTLKNVPVL